MTESFKAGDKVRWGSSGHDIKGTVEKKVTGTERVKGHVAKASKDDPQYKVKSDKTGAEAIHKPDDLRKA